MIITKYKLFENKYKDFLTEEEVKDFFNTHLNSDRVKDFFNKYLYPFYPIIPVVRYNHDKEKCIYTLIFKFIKDNSESTFTYEIDYRLDSTITYNVSIRVTHVNNDDFYILIDYTKKKYLYHTNDFFPPLMKKEEILNIMKNEKGWLIFMRPVIKDTPDGSRDFLNLKTFIIDLKLIPILNKYKSNMKPLDTNITTDDKDYYHFRNQLDITDFHIQKRNDEWIYFDYRDVYDFLSNMSVSNENNTNLHIQYMIHEQYLPKIVKLYKEVKKEVNYEFNN